MKLATSIFITIIAGGLFAFRDSVCKYLFPDMKMSSGEWDGANRTTMNFFSMMIFMSFLLCRINSENKHLKWAWDIIIGLSLSDVIDRFYFKIGIFTKEDWGLLIGTIVISTLDSYTKYNVEWMANRIIRLLSTPFRYLWQKAIK